MSPEKLAARSRHHAVVAAGGRVQVRLKKAEVRENRFTFLRFSSTLVLLAVLTGAASNEPALYKVIAIAIFVLFFIGASRLHDLFKARVQFWKALDKSFQASQFRIERLGQSLRTLQMPWHDTIAAGVPAGHLYAVDLDAHTDLFLLLNSCATHEGATRLFDEMMQAGLQPLPMGERQTRLKELVRLAAVPRHLDVFKFSQDEAVLKKQASLKSTTSVSDVPALPRWKVVALAVFAVAAIAIWAVKLLPAWILFFQTGSIEALSDGLTSYLLIPIIGSIAFRDVVVRLQSAQAKTKLMRSVFKTMSRLGSSRAFQSVSGVAEKADQKLLHVGLAVDWIEVRSNPLLWLLLHILFPFDPVICLYGLWAERRVADRVDAWWNDAVTFDVDCALARLAWENPDFSFCTPHTDATDKTVSCEQLGHPLLPYSKRVPNDIVLDNTQATVLLTGSNMSGKSTFLRTLGLNMLLFNMGAPVCARAFRSAQHRILCAIRVDDSLADNTSYFYAEVKRLKRILTNVAEGGQALFLIDEIFRGTNNRERYMGSLHVITALARSEAVGLVSTHDLALTELAKTQPRLCNMHFREHVEDGHLVFDYTLRLGPCPTTNALHIMRAEGLPIPEGSG